MKFGPRSPEMGPDSAVFAPHDEQGFLSTEHGQELQKDVANIEQKLPKDDVLDSEIVAHASSKYMRELYQTHRYGEHVERMLTYYDKYEKRTGATEEERESIEINKMAIAMHDLVDHGILHPEKTAARLGLGQEYAEKIGLEGRKKLREILDSVGDQDGFIKAYSFAIDASRWEDAARSWRKGANLRHDQLKAEGDMLAYSGKIVDASINKTKLLDEIGSEEIRRVLRLKENVLRDLEIEAISETTLNHNVQGLFLKSIETLDGIEHPPENNPASTWRDCIEALNFFVPALDALGYKELAMDLRAAALMWLYDDPNGYAKRQFEASTKYFDEINEVVLATQAKSFAGITLGNESRIKTEGSTRAKFAEKYPDLEYVPDGVGFAFIVEDNDMSLDKIDYFADKFMKNLTSRNPGYIAKHPKSSNKVYEKEDKDSGYQAIHMNFYYYPDDGSGEAVPFEIQVMTRSQYREKMYGKYSDLFYKAKVDFEPGNRPHLDRLEKRAFAERELGTGLTIQSISEILSISPELPFVFNKLFRAVDIGKGTRLMVPPELEKITHSMAKKLAEVYEGEEGLLVIPPSYVSVSQFKEALSIFSPHLEHDQRIVDALELIKKSEAGNVRADGKTPNLEGHILPTALASLMLAIQNGKIWDSKKVHPSEYMANVVAIALLHDFVEPILQKAAKNNPESIDQLRRAKFLAIQQKFGLDIREGVEAMTLPVEIKNQTKRRNAYSKQVSKNGFARIIKPLDRWQNHVTDLVRLASGEVAVNSLDWQIMMDYFTKTDRHQSKDFTGKDVPKNYKLVHDIIWKLAAEYGYEKKDEKTTPKKKR